MAASFPGRGHVYDLAIVGAGITGSEAALAAAAAGRDVLLVTTSLDSLYMLAHASYRLRAPAGTMMAELAARLAPAGAPVDRWELHREAKYRLEAQSGIHLLQSNVTGLIVAAGRVVGVRTWEGVERRARCTALCVGSFLRARLRQGLLEESAGRLGEMAYDELAADLEGLGLSFTEARIGLDEGSEGPPYTVSFSRLAAGALAGDYAVGGVAALYAAGAVALECTYEEAAAAGRDLGAFLAR